MTFGSPAEWRWLSRGDAGLLGVVAGVGRPQAGGLRASGRRQAERLWV